MKPFKRISDTALVLPVCGTVLFLPPYIQIFDQDLQIAGIPFLYIALFSIWVIGIVLTAIVARHLSRVGRVDDTEHVAPPSDQVSTQIVKTQVTALE